MIFLTPPPIKSRQHEKKHELPWFVIVTYGSTYIDILSRFRALVAGVASPERVVVVDTKNSLINGELTSFQGMNSSFEFSGYDAGASWIANREINTWLDCVILNDTIFESHSRLHIITYLKKILQLDIQTTAIVGMVFDFKGIEYIPSYLFRLKIEREKIIKHPNFFSSRLPLEGTTTIQYKSAIKNWLQPNKFWSGWHKAIPGKPLDESTYERKKIAIQLEHSLLERFKLTTDGQVIDLKSNNIAIIITAFIDRVFINKIKISSRLKYFIAKKP